MENVPEITRTSNLKDFLKWTKSLENMGYKNYFEILNAKDYGIPQNRRRVFMVSILGNYNYSFPIKLRLRHKLKDFLEEKVNEKYYLSQKMVKYISAYNEKWTGNNGGSIINKDIGCTINTAPGQRRCDASNYVSNDLPNNYDLKGGLPIIEDNKQGYKIAHEGDGINISGRNKYQRGNVQKDSCQTIKTSPDIGVMVVKKYENYLTWKNKKGDFNTQCNRACKENGSSLTIPTSVTPNVFENNLRIRKLTPLECMNLMGFTENDYQALRDIQMSDTAIYHMAGDSIVVPVLMGIFSKLFNNDDKHIELINDYVEGIKEDEI